MKLFTILSFGFLLCQIFFVSCSVNLSTSSTSQLETVLDSGAIISKNIDVDMFRYMEIDLNAEIELIQSDTLNVHVEGQESVLKFLTVYVSNSHLVIKLKKQNCRYNQLKIKVYVPSIQKIALNGSGICIINSWKNEDKLQFENNGSAEFQVANLNHVKNIFIEINGAGSFITKGDSKLIHQAHCELNGSGDMNLEHLQISQVNAEINGSGNVELGEIEQLHAEIVGSGNITYLGNPKIHQEIIGSGSIHQK